MKFRSLSHSNQARGGRPECSASFTHRQTTLLERWGTAVSSPEEATPARKASKGKAQQLLLSHWLLLFVCRALCFRRDFSFGCAIRQAVRVLGGTRASSRPSPGIAPQ
jgi:hypothetical protein